MTRTTPQQARLCSDCVAYETVDAVTQLAFATIYSLGHVSLTQRGGEENSSFSQILAVAFRQELGEAKRCTGLGLFTQSLTGLSPSKVLWSSPRNRRYWGSERNSRYQSRLTDAACKQGVCSVQVMPALPQLPRGRSVLS